jgi:hypothetical protein
MTGSDGIETFAVDAQTLILLGNGPSLRGVDLRALAPHATLGMNAAYRYWREINWRPRYYACLDLVVGMSHRDAIAELIAETGAGAIRRFLLRENLIAAIGPLARSERVLNFDALQLAFPVLRVMPITTGSHAALWAAAAGFRKIVLLGVDGKYVERIDGARPRGGIELEIVEEKVNPNYFFDGYQQKGDRYNIPNPRPGLHLEAWEAAASVLREEDIEVVNGNPDSAVRFFPWVSPAELVATGVSNIDERNVVAPAAQAGGDHVQCTDDKNARRLGSRAREFLRRQRTPLSAGALAMVAALIGVASAPSDAPRGGILLLLAAFSGLFLLGLIMRNAVSLHIAMLDRRIAALEAAMADLLRRQTCEAGGSAEEDGLAATDRAPH